MDNWRAPVGTKSGGCLCGAIRFECRTVYDVVYCHCSTCRHWSGAPVAISANVPTADFSVIKGTPQAYPSSQNGRRHFCEACGTHLYFTDDGPFVSVSVMALDETTDVRPRILQCAASKLDWFEIADDLPRYVDTRLPAPSEQTTGSASANRAQVSEDHVDAELFVPSNRHFIARKF